MMKVKNGDLDKLGLLFERYNRPLFSFFYRMCKEAELCEDLVQSVFERMLKYRDTYTGDGKFTTWMFSIARNAHIDHYRKQQREGIPVEIDEERLEVDEEEAKAVVNKKEKKELLEIALSRLDEDKREIIVLSRFEGLKYKEIADILDTTEGAIKVKMFRAMKELKDLVNTLNEECSHE
ncbi:MULTISPECIES: RNA polymerase sigma factor [Gracilimonas]|uniref:RNA polymerase sigma factor n=1 Tax=Gracilimonas sediminicola TaxID=2952158 RepID=A0A9X2L4H6_9BACT|nr:RNA polymerase sigma factor [Gracilimonas sediminicola]MCP9292057.1 RNA polymerase sigma factor [Gracilimonas sediminicola]